MNISEICKKARLAKGLSEQEIASKLNMTIYEYGDIESRKDELESAVNLASVKNLCRILNLNIIDLFNLEADIPTFKIERNQLIKQHRKNRNITIHELSDSIGFYPHVVDEMEKDPNFLESWCIDDIRALSKILDIPTTYLLGDI